MKKTQLANIYKYIETTKSYVIEISLDYYQELFNDWDASPTRKKDLDPELVTFIEASSYDIPKNYNIQFKFTLPSTEKNTKREQKAIDGIKNYFKSNLYFTNIELKNNLRRILTYILLGLSFISTAYFAELQEQNLFGFDVLIEGIFIGGWVLLWEAFSLFFFKSYSIRKRTKMYVRFQKSDIVFDYIDDNKVKD